MSDVKKAVELRSMAHSCDEDRMNGAPKPRDPTETKCCLSAAPQTVKLSAASVEMTLQLLQRASVEMALHSLWEEDGRASLDAHVSDDETVANMGHPKSIQPEL